MAQGHRRTPRALDAVRTRPPVDATLPRERLPTRRLVRADVIAERLGVPEEHVKRNWKKYPFAVPVSKRVIRYDPVAFDAYLDGLTQARTR